MSAGTGCRLIARMTVRGIAAAAMASGIAAARAADTPRAGRDVEIVRFADRAVAIVRGAVPGATPPAASTRIAARTVERITFAGAAPASVLVIRGIGATGGLSSADGLRLSPPYFAQIAWAVHGAESSRGADPAMWRPDPDGPQGPMQVSEAAARDVGGGDRFDSEQNLLLGRAYLARMLHRYGNWPEALAAYNWGPGNVDRWIAGGRDPGRLPRETTRYIDRVLRDALIAGAADRPAATR